MRLPHYGYLLLTVMLSACGTPEPTHNVFEVTAVYTNPDEVSAINPSVAGAVSMSFGNNTVAGFTGCAPFQGFASLDQQHARFSQMQFDPISDECSGQNLSIHNALVSLLVDGEFEVDSRENGILILRSHSEGLEPSSIHLISKG
ncbi:putative secreted protein [Corynebacterium kutscheri]|uniref:Secreted protein n=1 Tax=Corynebacterium kutscheri TaxID=35755 RepID=A0A0F6TD17_9CORY|nr:hypothetical protein [Corynebacterium kutscheri]AKE40764.1 hypothetical protein UL82_02695 [Corynebacterium kutscheri]VEH04546.1 putative secreted protein [Corynebacterium kutscheri]VEH11162.1 putative secreted protein [Corynebacterium kutscheri]VEH80361.1 putative secreted protein [Corynebacterium kutscheri]